MIRRLFFIAALIGAAPSSVAAQETGARVDAGESTISQTWSGGTVIQLHMSEGVPFRVFTLADPARLVLDFKGLSWSDSAPTDLIADVEAFSDIRFGTFQQGWTRLVADMNLPMLPDEIGMAVEQNPDGAVLTVSLSKADRSDFLAASGVPQDALWPQSTADIAAPSSLDGRFVVAIDPGHGGVDPGAERNGVSEKELMLDFAIELKKTLEQNGDVDVILTRDHDTFVSLEGRVAQAHRAGADVFLSLHADALSQGGAQGATVYTLSKEASDTATALLATRHNRADVIAGLDLTGADDEVAQVLLDLARQETEPRSGALAHVMVQELINAGGPVNNRPLRQAGFSVLKSADIPSVLLEVGFLSSERDLDNILNPVWRSKIAGAVARSIMLWHEKDNRRRALLRQ